MRSEKLQDKTETMQMAGRHFHIPIVRRRQGKAVALPRSEAGYLDCADSLQVINLGINNNGRPI